MPKKIFSIIGMHCSSCVISVDGELEDLPGVIEARTNYAKQKIEITVDGSVSDEVIIETIAGLGYSAQVDTQKS